MEEELSHPLTLWKLHHTTIAIVRGWKLLLLHRRLLTATTAQDGDRVSTVCIAAAAPAAPCFARLIISPLVSQTRSSLFEFSKKESAHAETVPCASRLLAQDRSLGAGSRKPASAARAQYRRVGNKNWTQSRVSSCQQQLRCFHPDQTVSC